MKPWILNRQEGFTIVEVIVSAIIFMIGFSILVFMLNQAFTKYSVKDMTTATHIGSGIMERSLAARDTVDLDTVVVASEISYRVKKVVRLDNDLAAITVTVKREKKAQELCRFYGEYTIR